MNDGSHFVTALTSWGVSDAEDGRVCDVTRGTRQRPLRCAAHTADLATGGNNAPRGGDPSCRQSWLRASAPS